MNKAYTKIVWQNLPSVATPLNASNLNAMSDALDTIDDRVVEMSTSITEIDSVVDRVSTLETDVSGVASRLTAVEQEVGGASISTTLLANAWENASQTITVTGMTANSNGFIDVAHNATTAQREASRDALLYITAQASNSITVTADGDIPEIDIPVTVVIL